MEIGEGYFIILVVSFPTVEKNKPRIYSNNMAHIMFLRTVLLLTSLFIFCTLYSTKVLVKTPLVSYPRNHVYLISNSVNVTDAHIQSIGISNTDTIMVFNGARVLGFQFFETFPKEKIFLMVRSGGGSHSFNLSEERLTYLAKKVGRIIFVDDIPSYTTIAHLEGEILQYVRYQSILVKVQVAYPGKIPSTGFLGYFYASLQFPTHALSLVAFTGTRSDNRPSILHNFTFEQEYYMSDRIPMLFAGF